jgi:alpha-galactosidase
MEDGFWLDHYQFELFESIAESMLDLCPDAWYVQLANPVLQGITLLHRKYPGLKKVGLCHGFGGVYRISRQLGLDEEKVSFTAPGINHFIWLTNFEYEGRDAYPLLDDWIRDESGSYWEGCGICDQMGPVPVDLYRRFGVFPIGDTCTPGGGSWPWWYHVDDETERGWKVDPRTWWEGYFENSRKKTERMIEVSKGDARVTEEYPPGRTGELVIPLVEAISCDLPRTLQVNIGNSGSVLPGVPEDFEVEIPATVDGRGISGNPVEGLPGAVNAFLLRDRVAPVEVELGAYLEGSREGLLDLILMDPWTTSLEQAGELLDDILSMDFHGELRHHYR